ncbi:MAG: LytR/AlgR family response regulator transcription factor [Bacteroidota bacterium]
MNVLIVEDEQPNMRMLTDMLKALRPGWNVCGQLESVKQSVSFLSVNPQPDLILMDIQLSDGICFSVFEQVEVRSSIIFTTAFDNYAIQAFKVNSIDYLLKPVKAEELDKALLKLEERMAQQGYQLADYNDIIRAIRSGSKEYRKRFLLNTGNKYTMLDVRDLACFESENRVTTAVSFSGERHVIDFSLDRLEDELDPELFFRADRKTIIHIGLISRIEDYFGNKLIVRLKHPLNTKLTISRLKASAFKLWIDH